jgi:membrane-associated phospholipid phosphatase
MHWAGGIFERLYHSVEHGYQYANATAAVPSLHAAFSLLVAITLWPIAGRRWRPLLVAYPLAMAFTVVYTGEHYVADVLLGWLYTTGSVLAVRAVRGRLPQARESRLQARPADGAPGRMGTAPVPSIPRDAPNTIWLVAPDTRRPDQ